jgi:hypothetical protein
MKRPKLICLLVATFLLSFVLTAFFGDWFVERVALLPLVRKYEIVKPRTPLVINTREEVRISDTSDLVAIANKSKDRLAALTEEASGVVRLRGSLVAISSDGWYLASKQSFGSKDPKGLFVKTENGTEAVDQLVFDDFTDIVLVKTKLLSRAVMSVNQASMTPSPSCAALKNVMKFITVCASATPPSLRQQPFPFVTSPIANYQIKPSI